MLDLSLLTIKPIDRELVKKIVNENFNKFKINESIYMDEEYGLMHDIEIINKKKKIFCKVDFESGLTCREDHMYDEKVYKASKIEDPYWFSFYFNDIPCALKFVSLLLPYYPELFIYDSEYDWIGTGEEFLTGNPEDHPENRGNAI